MSEKASVFQPFMDPCDIHLPQDVTSELQRCATANGRINYEYLLAIYRAGVASGRVLFTCGSCRHYEYRESVRAGNCNNWGGSYRDPEDGCRLGWRPK